MASAPEAMALQMSPPVRRPPSVMMATSRPRASDVFVSGGGAFKGGGYLRHADTQDLSAGAGGPGPDTHQQPGNPSFH